MDVLVGRLSSIHLDTLDSVSSCKFSFSSSESSFFIFDSIFSLALEVSPSSRFRFR
ncbi:unnamed protein product [Meloidogyne enterolobii]|uniref:Uncharacterized protein n=1 Tax=Meloidogyne enterolobii TaxID=390850 RepID=A0ACB0ZLQ8_MELEN